VLLNSVTKVSEKLLMFSLSAMSCEHESQRRRHCSMLLLIKRCESSVNNFHSAVSVRLTSLTVHNFRW